LIPVVYVRGLSAVFTSYAVLILWVFLCCLLVNDQGLVGRVRAGIDGSNMDREEGRLGYDLGK
jgi:hypothetical protein